MTDSRTPVLYVVDMVETGGAERVLIRLANCLSMKYRPYLYAAVESNGYGNYDTGEIVIIESPVSRGGGFFYKCYGVILSSLKLVSIARKENIRTIVSFLERSNIISILAGKLIGAKVIVSVRSNIEHQYFVENPVLHSLVLALVGFFYRRADMVVTLSKGVEDQIAVSLKLDDRKLITIYNPYPLDYYRAVAASRNAVDSSTSLSVEGHFVASGRLTRQKGFDHLIKSYAIYHGEVANPRKLFILGDGDQLSYLSSLVDFYDLTGKIVFLGYRVDALKIVSTAYCFLFSSRWEGFGNALLEAIACGVPAISTDCKYGPREIMGAEAFEYPIQTACGVIIREFGEHFNSSLDVDCGERVFAAQMQVFNRDDYEALNMQYQLAQFDVLYVRDRWDLLLGGE